MTRRYHEKTQSESVMARIDREKLGELLSGYIDNELDPRERQIIERVLREDESARQLLADLRRTAQAVASLPRHAAPASILGDTQATLERSAILNDFPEPRAHQTRGRSSWTARWAMAAILGLVLVTGWWFTTEQVQRGSKSKAGLVQQEVREAAPIAVPARSAVFEDDRSIAAPVASIEQQLALGVHPTSFRSQTFAAEPLRLQVRVRGGAEREAVSTRIAAALSGQQLADLASVSGAGGDTTGSVQRFYYRGQAGVNFDATNEDQILVRASPQQIDQLLTELSSPDRSDETVALVAGPIAVQGVEKSRSVVQLLGDRWQPGAPRNEMTRGDELVSDKDGATGDVDRTSADESTAPSDGMLGGLLKIVGIDPKLLSSEAKPSAEPSNSLGESAAEAASQVSTNVAVGETSVADAKERDSLHRKEAKSKAAKSVAIAAKGQLPAPAPLVERRLQAASRSSGESGKTGDSIPSVEPAWAAQDAYVTMIIQIIETPSPTQPPPSAKTKPDPPAARKNVE